jgi:hypothetical protein
MRITIVPLLLALLLAPLAGADEAADVAACIARDFPEPDSVRAVRISSRDRAGFDRDTVVQIYGRRTDSGREILVRFLQPEELAGSAFLMLERDGPNEMYFKGGDLGKAKRVKGGGRALSLLGTDFSYEDFEHLLAFKSSAPAKRLEDSKVRGRATYVVEARPNASAGSAYERVVTYTDKETCVALRTELYEKGKGLRKTLMVNPTVLQKRGSVWIPQLALMEDLLNYTSTVFMVDTTEHNVELSDEFFQVDTMGVAP